MGLDFYDIFKRYYNDGVASKYELVEVAAYKKITRDQFVEITNLDFMETVKEGYSEGKFDKDTIDLLFKNKVITLDEYNSVLTPDTEEEEGQENKEAEE